MPAKQRHLALDEQIMGEVDAVRGTLSPAETRSLFYNTAAKQRLTRIKRQEKKNA